MEKFVYSLEEKIDKIMLGQKGKNLTELYEMQLPIPNSIILTTEAHKDYKENGKITRDLEKQITEYLKTIEIKTNKKLGDIISPLLLSVRESPVVDISKKETLINIGLNDNIAANLAVDEESAKFIYDTYRKLIMMYANIVKGKSTSPFEILIEKYKEKRNVENNYELTAEDLFQITNESKKIYRKITGEKFPKDPEHQLLETVKSIYNEWQDIDVAVIIEEMIFANLNQESYIGVAFSSDPKTGEDNLTGALSYQVQEKTANIKPVDILLKKDINIYNKLVKYSKKLERKYKTIIKISFIVENGKLYILNSKKAKIKESAALTFALKMLEKKEFTEADVLNINNIKEIHYLTYNNINTKAAPIAKGNKGIPEAISGQISLDIENIGNDKRILIKEKLLPEDVKYINSFASIITIHNNEINELVEEMGKIHIKNCPNIKIDNKNKIVKINGQIFEENSYITLDGATGNIYEGKLEITPPESSENLNNLLKLAKQNKNINIITNEIPIEELTDGIGIFKIENTLFDKEKILLIRKLILSEPEEQEKILNELSEKHIRDIEKLFRLSNDKTLTIKLLDMKLRDFLPITNEEIYTLANELKIDIEKLNQKLKSLENYNEIIDLKGSSLALKYPEIIKVEIEAIFRAMINASNSGYKINPEIIIPKVNSNEQLQYIKEIINNIHEKLLKQNNLNYKLGTIIETPRDIVLSSDYAKEVDLLIFDLSKLTINTYGLNEKTLEKEFIKNPIEIIDKEGVGKLMTVVSKISHQVNPDIKLGTFGKQNEDERSIRFFKKIGIDNLYIKPHQLPVALINAARSEINGNKWSDFSR